MGTSDTHVRAVPAPGASRSRRRRPTLAFESDFIDVRDYDAAEATRSRREMR